MEAGRRAAPPPAPAAAAVHVRRVRRTVRRPPNGHCRTSFPEVRWCRTGTSRGPYTRSPRGATWTTPAASSRSFEAHHPKRRLKKSAFGFDGFAG